MQVSMLRLGEPVAGVGLQSGQPPPPFPQGRGLDPSLLPLGLVVPLLYLPNTLRHQGRREFSRGPVVMGRARKPPPVRLLDRLRGMWCYHRSTLRPAATAAPSNSTATTAGEGPPVRGS